MSCGGHHARPRLGLHLVLPDLLAGLRIESANRAVTRIVRHIDIRNAADIAIAGRVLRLALQIEAFVLPDREIELAGQRTIRRRIPVRRALHAGPDVGALLGRIGIGQPYRPALRIESLGPGLFRERLAQQELAGRRGRARSRSRRDAPSRSACAACPASRHPPAPEPARHPSRSTSCGTNWKCHFSLPGVGIERDGRIGIEVVARAHIGIPVRRRISDAPDDQIQLGIVRSGDPCRAAALLPRVAGPQVSWPFLARPRNRC